MAQSGRVKGSGAVLSVVAVGMVILGLVTDVPEKNSTWIYLIAIAASFLAVLCFTLTRRRTAHRSAG